MATKKSGDFFKGLSFTKGLRALLDSLPSESERRQIDAQLQTLIDFLTDLRHRLSNIPSREDAAASRAAVDQLDALFAQAKSNPFLATALGVKVTASRRKPAPVSSDDISRARSTLARLQTLTLHEIRATLNPMARIELQAVASALGIRGTQRATHESLVQQVATKITNTRGYRSLRDGADEQVTIPDEPRRH
jgi:hypothetical protein